LKAVLDILAQISGLPAPAMKIPHRVALGVAYAETAFSRLIGREPQIPVEGVRIAQHMMFVDCKRAPRELGFQPGSATAAFQRAVRWYQANGYIAPRRAKKITHAAAA
jgi:dihydroflavonol-4-reductase